MSEFFNMFRAGEVEAYKEVFKDVIEEIEKSGGSVADVKIKRDEKKEKMIGVIFRHRDINGHMLESYHEVKKYRDKYNL